jgi:anti-sigma regulatory factor (Ser/Thr protein kinase)
VGSIVPLSRPALVVGSGPRSAQEARRWVVGIMREIGRPELEETTELGVSELVTNAVLHAEPPIEVRVRGTRLHPRVEVRDGSTESPQMPTPVRTAVDPVDLDEDDLLITFGRGLDIVARCSDAWGAEIEDAGKVLWFAPATELRDTGVPGAVTGQLDAVTRAPGAEVHPFHLLGVPVRSLAGFQRHYQELRREVRLLALAHEAEYPLAKTLSDLFGSMQRELRDGLDAARTTHLRPGPDGTVDLVVHLSRESAVTMGRFVELLDFADEFCSRERMLSLARTAEQRLFQTWFLTEFVRQQGGASPRPWAEPAYRAQA